MLAQAQECFIEKVLLEKKKGILVAKLSMHLSSLYTSVVDGLNVQSLKNQMPRSWVELFKVKQKYFHAHAFYHQAIQCGISSEYGKAVAYSILAAEQAEAALKLGFMFRTGYPKFSVASEVLFTPTSFAEQLKETVMSFAFEDEDIPPSTASVAVEEMCKTLSQLATKLKETNVKDNDLVYHYIVPELEGLPQIEKLNAVKTSVFQDLLPGGAEDIPKIVGPDIFQKLIPIRAHESSSFYFEEKGKIVRMQVDAVNLANGDYEATLSSLNVLKTLSRLKNAMKSPSKKDDQIPESLINAIQAFIAEDNGQDIDSLILKIADFKLKIRGKLDQIMSGLNSEQQACENFRSKYLDKWTQDPSSRSTGLIIANWKKYHSQLQEAADLDRKVLEKIDEISKFRKLLKNPITRICEEFSKEILSGSESPQSLLDDDFKSDADFLSDRMLIEKIEELLNTLKVLRKERDDALSELKKMVYKLLLIKG